MVNAALSWWLARVGGIPSFRVHGKSRSEAQWRVIDVFATHRRNIESRWPLCKGTCITWTDRVIVVGWDFAEDLLREQVTEPASQQRPVEVAGGRLNHSLRRGAAGIPSFATASEILAHECGHTRQARRLGIAYLPVVGSMTLFREGTHFWNHFENDASEQGQFGGIVNGSVHPDLMKRITSQPGC